VRIRIEGTGLPGVFFGPRADRSGERPNAHVGVQSRGRRGELLGLVRGDSPSATWTLDCTAARTAAAVDLKGPYVQGPPGGRFIYLSWVDVAETGDPTMFRRAKLWLEGLPGDAVEAAIAGGVLVGRLRLTDERGGPLFASVRPPRISWTAEPSSSGV
jgi:hypothetical protein